MTTLGERLILARKTAKMSQEDVALAADVSQGTIGNIEAGIRKRPRELLRIAAAVGVSPEWLSTGDGSMEGGGPPPMEWPFELLTREQWKALTERQRGAVEAAAQRALQNLHLPHLANTDAAEPVTPSGALAAAFEAIPPELQRQMYASLMAAAQDPKAHVAMLRRSLTENQPSGERPARSGKPPAAVRAGPSAKRTHASTKVGRR